MLKKHSVTKNCSDLSLFAKNLRSLEQFIQILGLFSHSMSEQLLTKYQDWNLMFGLLATFKGQEISQANFLLPNFLQKTNEIISRILPEGSKMGQIKNKDTLCRNQEINLLNFFEEMRTLCF